MKKVITLLILFCTASTFSQSNQDLLSHYKKYYKQMQSQADIQGVINALTHLNVLEPSQARKDTLATLYMNEGRHVEALNTIGVEKNDSDSDLAEFKKLINEKIDKAKHDLEPIKSAYMNDHNNGTEDTSPTFKAFDEGSTVMSKESNSQLALRQEKFIRDLKTALIRIENKTYGICRVTGKLISKQRLKLVPHATLSIEAKNMQK